MKVKFIALGSDPEMFIKGPNGEPISAEGLLGGTKDEPRKLSENGHAVQEDNVMVEFNIPPVRDAIRLVKEIEFAKAEILKLLPEGCTLEASPSMDFSLETLSTEQALTFGCVEDYSVWGRVKLQKVTPEPTVRYAGGHIHISYEEPSLEVTEAIIKAMDCYLGIPAVFMDTDDRRKFIYGTPGRFRFTNYGLEYRVLSNFWLQSEELINWVFLQTMLALENVDSAIINSNEEIIQSIIKNNNKAEAEEFCKKYQIPFIKNKIKVYQHE